MTLDSGGTSTTAFKLKGVNTNKDVTQVGSVFKLQELLADFNEREIFPKFFGEDIGVKMMRFYKGESFAEVNKAAKEKGLDYEFGTAEVEIHWDRST